MSESYYHTKINIIGTKEDYIKVTKLVESFCERDKHDVFFSNLDIVETNDGIYIEADGPHGFFYKLPEISFFKVLADEIPDAYFSASVEGEATYYDESLKCTLINQLLSIDAVYVDHENDYYDEEDDEIINDGVEFHEVYDTLEHIKAKYRARELKNLSTKEICNNNITCYYQGHLEGTIFVIGTIILDRKISVERLIDEKLVDVSDFTESKKNTEWYAVDINRPVIVWNSIWRVQACFENNMYCATFLSLKNSEEDLVNFELIKAYAQSSFGEVYMYEENEYCFMGCDKVTLQYEKAFGWRLMILSD